MDRSILAFLRSLEKLQIWKMKTMNEKNLGSKPAAIRMRLREIEEDGMMNNY